MTSCLPIVSQAMAGAAVGAKSDVYALLLINVVDRPEPPMNVTVRCQATAAEVDWWPGHNGNDDVTSYAVFYHTLEAGGSSYEVAANSTSRRVPVRPWLNYTFRVEAHNEVGWSEASETVYCTTLQTAPAEHPHNVCTETRGSSQLVIVWQVHFLVSVFFTSWWSNCIVHVVLTCSFWWC